MTATWPVKTMGHEPTTYADWNTYVRDNMAYLKDSFAPKRATVWIDEATVLTGNAINLGVLTTQMYNSIGFQNAAANGDALTWSVWLLTGSYTLYILGQTNPDAGIQDIYLDGVLAASTIDWYSAGGVQNVIKSAAVTITGTGYHVLKSVVNGKTGSDYRLYLTKLWLRPTAD